MMIDKDVLMYNIVIQNQMTVIVMQLKQVSTVQIRITVNITVQCCVMLNNVP